MAFWSSETLRKRLSRANLISPCDPSCVHQGAYELSLGPEVFITFGVQQKKQKLDHGEPVTLPPGQFGMLLTEEVVSIPNDAISFISIRTKVKFRGLVNVSGFHVDPGFRGRLRFSVYNAGSKPIILQRGDRVFLIWFSDLDQPTKDVYVGNYLGQMEISSDDQNLLQGEVASPAQLQREVSELRHSLSALEHQLSVLRALVIGVGGALLASLIAGLAVFFLSQASRPTPPVIIQTLPIEQSSPTPIPSPLATAAPPPVATQPTVR